MICKGTREHRDGKARQAGHLSKKVVVLRAQDQCVTSQQCPSPTLPPEPKLYAPPPRKQYRTKQL